MYIFLSPSSPPVNPGVRKIALFKILLYVLKWWSRFTLGLNAAKNTDYNENSFKWKLLKINFAIINSEGAHIFLQLE